jgi:hypothetical protein
MTPSLPADLAERPHDLRYGVPVPFACQPDDGTGDLGEVVKKRVVQCALSRICGLCGISLSYGVTFLGSPEEAEANLFHFPPLHRAWRSTSTRPWVSRCSGSSWCCTSGRWW